MTTTFEDLQRVSRQANTPWDASIELTYRCNERCAMCYLGPDWGKGRKGDELTTQEVFSLLDALHEAGCFEVLITGGEVCLRKDLIEILDYAGSKGFVLTLKTNGTMVTPELGDAVSRNPVKQVDMSILGATAAVHDAVTKIPGSFDKTMRGIRIMRERDIPVQLNFTAMTLNFREIAETRKLAESYGCMFEWSAQVTPRDDRSIIPLTLRLPDKEMQEVQEMKHAETAHLGDDALSNYQTESWFCGAGRYSLNITPYGEVQPCILMRMDCGNIRERPFLEIWESSPVLKRLRAMRIAEVYGCNDCKVRDYCQACPGLFFMEMGDVTIPSPHTCEMAEMRYQAATGTYVACGARDADGNLPKPINSILGIPGQHPVTLHVGPVAAHGD